MRQAEIDIEKKLGHRKFRVLFTKDQIEERVKLLADSINKDFKDTNELVIVGVLKGSFIFIADLVRHVTVPTRIEFIGVSSYSGKNSTGQVRLTHDFVSDIKGKDVLLIEDIIDTGETIDFLIQNISHRGPGNLKIAALFSKPSKTKAIPFRIDYVGFLLTDEFVIGYGLDWDQRYRELPHIVELMD